jgi:hypothetical protein
MSSREVWFEAFEAIGFNRIQVRQLTEEDFCEKCQFIYGAGLAPPNVSVPTPSVQRSVVPPPVPSFGGGGRKPPFVPSNESSGTIRTNQNIEFELAERNEQRRKEREEEEQKLAVRREKERLEDEEAERRRFREEIRSKAASLPESPNGVLIAIELPTRTRVQRKFDPKQLGSDVLAFVANQEEMFDENGYPLDFELIQGKDELVKEKTLEEQGITRRTLMHVAVFEKR